MSDETARLLTEQLGMPGYSVVLNSDIEERDKRDTDRQKEITNANRGMEALARDLREAVVQVQTSQTTAMGCFTALLSLARGLAQLKQPKAAKAAMILTPLQQGQLTKLILHAEKAVAVVDPTGQVAAYVDQQRAQAATQAVPGVRSLVPVAVEGEDDGQ